MVLPLGQDVQDGSQSTDGLDRAPPQTEFAQQRWEFLFAQANGDRLVLSEMLNTKEKAEPDPTPKPVRRAL